VPTLGRQLVEQALVRGSAKDTDGALDSVTTGFLSEVLKMVERFRSSSQSALGAATTGAATTVDSPALFLGKIIRKVGAAIGKTAGGVAKTAGSVLCRVARMVGRAFGR
jgi:hypothetical protein